MLREDLPAGVHEAVERRTGPVATATPANGGVNSDLAVTLDAATGRHFCKAIAADSRMAWMHRNERAVHSFLPDIAPTLNWAVEQDGWLLLGL